jgi:hypothetical protein
MAPIHDTCFEWTANLPGCVDRLLRPVPRSPSTRLNERHLDGQPCFLGAALPLCSCDGFDEISRPRPHVRRGLRNSRSARIHIRRLADTDEVAIREIIQQPLTKPAGQQANGPATQRYPSAETLRPPSMVNTSTFGNGVWDHDGFCLPYSHPCRTSATRSTTKIRPACISASRKASTVRLGVVSDIHHCPQGSPPDGWHNPHQFADAGERLRRSIRWLEQQHVERLAVLGDLTHFGDPASTREVLDILSESSLPIWILPGNHDLNPDRSVLDTLLVDRTDGLEPMPGHPVEFGPSWIAIGLEMKTAADGRGYHATNHDEVVTLASGDTPTLLLSHFPLLGIREDVLNAGLKYAGDLTNGIAISDSLLD